MRISTATMFATATNQMGTLQSQLSRTQMQLATGRSMLTPADDPVASARALEVTQSQSMNTQFSTNRQNARSSLSQVEQVLTGTTDLLENVQTLVVQAGNGTLAPSDRNMLATEMEGRLNDLLGLANTADGAGGYLFSGYRTATAPFIQTAGGAFYQGDQGQRQMQVGSARQMAISDSGSTVFENNRTGNGSFQAAASGANTGTGVVRSGSVTNAALLTGHDYQVQFSVSAATPPVTTYTVTDTSTSPASAVLSAAPYKSGQPIAFNGMAFDVSGAPANGDTFTVKPSQKQSVFSTITDMIAALRSTATDPASMAALGNSMNTGAENLQGALDNVLTVRASVGSRLKELDQLDSVGDDMNIQYASTLSGLQDLDIAKAISAFSQQQMTLEAAQKSFKSMSGLSLFNYIG